MISGCIINNLHYGFVLIFIRKKLSGKRLFGFLPTINVKTAFRDSVLVRRYKRQIFRKALSHVTSQVVEISKRPEGGTIIKFNNQGTANFGIIILKFHYLVLVRFVHIRVPFFITDEKDLAGCVTGMFASSACRRPCNCCILDFFEEPIYKIGPPRQLDEMRKVSVAYIKLLL